MENCETLAGMAEQLLKERMDFILRESQIYKNKGLASCQWKVNIIMISQLLLLKKKTREKEREERKSHAFSCTASKRICTKGIYVCKI